MTRRLALVLLFTLAVAPRLHAQTILTPRQHEIVVRLHAAHRDLAGGTDDERRQLTRLIVEQVRFEFGPDWGTKSAGVGRPPSKDSLAHRVGATLMGCDWQNGGTREPFTPVGCADITGQLFIEVSPINHLGLVGPVDPGPPPPGTCQDTTDTLTAIASEARAFRVSIQDQLNAHVQGLAEGIATLHAEHVAQDEKVNKIVAFFKDPKTLLTIAGVLAGRFAWPK
jgi:hypothetical protein